MPKYNDKTILNINQRIIIITPNNTSKIILKTHTINMDNDNNDGDDDEVLYARTKKVNEYALRCHFDVGLYLIHTLITRV